MRPRLAVTLGDPAGIGPEVILKALAVPAIRECADITVVGSRDILKKTVDSLSDKLRINLQQLNILDVSFGEVGEIVTGQGNVASGAASFAYMEAAIALTLAGEFDGIVTGPIAKTLWKAAGHDYPGQTELVAERSGVKRFGMLFVAKSPYTAWTLRTLLVTTHIPLCQVPAALNSDLLSLKLGLLVECLRDDFGLNGGRIVIAGLNPHSGENGQLGTEEKEFINDWLMTEKKRYPEWVLEGPVPPDTMWVKPGQAWFGTGNNGADGYLALYHDQGLIPVKLMAFDRAVNTTIGLPFVRTSPDHGTAFDIAGKGVADASSMMAAIEFAAQVVKNRLGK